MKSSKPWLWAPSRARAGLHPGGRGRRGRRAAPGWQAAGQQRARVSSSGAGPRPLEDGHAMLGEVPGLQGWAEQRQAGRTSGTQRRQRWCRDRAQWQRPPAASQAASWRVALRARLRHCTALWAPNPYCSRPPTSPRHASLGARVWSGSSSAACCGSSGYRRPALRNTTAHLLTASAGAKPKQHTGPDSSNASAAARPPCQAQPKQPRLCTLHLLRGGVGALLGCLLLCL